MTGNQIALWNVRRQEAADLAHIYHENVRLQQEEAKIKISEILAKIDQAKLRLDQRRLEWDKERHANELALQEKLGVLNANISYYNYSKQHESRVAQLEFESTKWAEQFTLQNEEFERRYDYLTGTESLKAYAAVAHGISAGIGAITNIVGAFNPVKKITNIYNNNVRK